MNSRQDEADSIYIESTRNPDTGAEAACLLRWGPAEWYAPVAAVRQTAEDLCACAAYADLIGELFRVGIESGLISQMTNGMLRDRQPRYFGGPDTMFLLPGGSSASKQGVVMFSKRDLFHRGKADGMLLPDQAREMARVWLTAAEASDADTLFSAALLRSGMLGTAEVNALFSQVSEIRAGSAELPPTRG